MENPALSGGDDSEGDAEDPYEIINISVCSSHIRIHIRKRQFRLEMKTTNRHIF